jgi:hypothetical protein
MSSFLAAAKKRFQSEIDLSKKGLVILFRPLHVEVRRKKVFVCILKIDKLFEKITRYSESNGKLQSTWANNHLRKATTYL